MTLESLLTVLRERGIRLWAEGDDLRYAAPTGALDDQLITAIRARKAEILAYLRCAVAMPRHHETIPRVARGSEPLRPSFAQQRLWFLDQLQPETNAFCWRVVLRLRGRLDVDALELALATIYQRHEVLRARFHDVEGELHVRIDDASRLELHRLDLPGDDDQARADAAHRAVNAEVQRPFDLTGGPLVRAHVMRINREDHVFLLAMHHIVSDGWSLGVLNDELGALYRAFTQGEPSPLPPLAVQYADFAAWQRQWLSGEVGKKQLQYWRSQLASLAPLELPTDRLRPTRQSFGAKSTKVTLPKQVSEAIAALGRDVGATPFMTLFAAFAALLRRYTGQDDIVVGSPIANRNRVEIEPLIGFFVNSLVLRADLAGDPTFRELLARVRTVAIDAFEHQDIPFEQLVQELHPERDLGRNPLFQVVFIVQNAGETTLTLPGVEVSRFDGGAPTTGFDIELHVPQCQDALEFNFIYNTDLFDAATIERMARHYQRLLEAIVADPDGRIADLPMLDDAERGLIVETWNVTATDYPRDACIHELFEAQAAQTPNAIALEFAGETLTYDALNRRANQVAHHLIGLGVGPEVKVGIALERSIEMVVGILGVLKAGGAYVPLDPGYPAERLAFMMQDTRAPVVLTQAHLESELPEHDGVVLRLDADWSRFAAEPETNPEVKTGPKSLAYVMYTSGSTGRPKGACIPHRSVIRLVWNTNYLSVTPADVFLQFAPISFDASTLELWGSLLNGAKLVVFPPQTPSLEELGRALETHGITTLWLTGALFQQMVNEQPDALAGVRQLLAGGDALSVPHVRRMIDRLQDEHRLINGYGPTENTTFTCCHVMGPDCTFARSVPIGRPIANTTAYIVDGNLEPVPVGVPGELYTGGDGLGRGYLNDPALTALRFVPNPFGEPGSRLYRTGDRARHDADGTMEFLGRSDFQVKLRGFRIELGEIETVLGEHPAVEEAVAALWEQEPGDQRLIAYVVASEAGEAGSEPDLADLERHVRERLPGFMVPSRVVLIDAIPLTANGKIDRRSLPAPDWQPQQRYVAPTSPLESKLVEIWQDILGVERIGIEDDFFRLGGHSILVARVLAWVRHAIGIDLTMREIFFAPTVSKLAQRIELAMLEAIEEMPEQEIAQHAAGLGEVT